MRLDNNGDCRECFGQRIDRCKACGACSHERHTESCRQAWRKLILSYGEPPVVPVD